VSNPAFTVVIPLYNKEDTVTRAIRSVLAQSVQDFEIVVVNDGSTDGGADKVEAIGDSRIRLVHQSNGGVSAARNRGVEAAVNPLIAFLDADDEWLPEYLETISGLHAAFGQCSVFATSYYCQVPGGERVPARHEELRRRPERGFVLSDYFQVAHSSDPPVHSSAVVVKAEALLAIGGFPVGVWLGEDLLTWARLAAKFQIAYRAKPCTVFWLAPAAVTFGRPNRSPDPEDRVGHELRALLAQPATPGQPGLRRYVSNWYKMQANMWLCLDQHAAAARAAATGMAICPLNARCLLYLLAALVPGRILRPLARSLLRRRRAGLQPD